MVRLSMDSRHFGRWPEIGKTDSRASDLRLHEQQPGMNGHSLDRRFTNYGFCPLRRIAPLFSAWKAGCDPTGSGRNLQPGREIRQRSTAGFDPGLKVGRERHRPSRLPYPTYRSPRGRCTFRPDPLRRPTAELTSVDMWFRQLPQCTGPLRIGGGLAVFRFLFCGICRWIVPTGLADRFGIRVVSTARFGNRRLWRSDHLASCHQCSFDE